MFDESIKQHLKEWIELWRLTDAAYNKLLKRWNLSTNAYFILEMLQENPEGVEPAVLADKINIVRPAVTVILNDFESKKLILRKEHKTDHRRKHILLSANGRRFADEVINAVHEIEMAGVAQMTSAERKAIIESSVKYYQVIKNAADNPA